MKYRVTVTRSDVYAVDASEREYSDSDIEDERDRIMALRAVERREAQREYWQELGREDAA